MSDHLVLTMPLSPDDAVAAIIVLDDERYLLQLRDDKAGIFYPGHWGLFGGGVEPGETPEQALVRELREELEIDITAWRYFTRMTFDFAYAGIGTLTRDFFIVELAGASLEEVTLGEGRAVEAFDAATVLTGLTVVPYDAFAIWQHVNSALIRPRA